jgi:HAD superfamily hydrolase (TIGR01490 family)
VHEKVATSAATAQGVPILAGVEAAFFDLDKTVIARPSMVAFGGPLRRDGLVSRRLLLRALWAQVIYLSLGADERRLARVRDAALRVSKGWEQRRISALVRETLAEVVDPIVYDEALDLLRMHREAGRKVFIVSASPEEIVAPLAQYLGADEAIATRAVLDDEGRYTGAVELYCYGPEKARILAEIAERDDIDLARSYAYSDSATDIPMLQAVGHAVAVNPDRELARFARTVGWEIVHFTHSVPLRERVSMPSATSIGVGSAAVAGVAGGGVAYWLWRERRRPPPPATRQVARQAQLALDRLRRDVPSWRPPWPGR